MARDYRKVSQAHGLIIVAHSILSSASGTPGDGVYARIGSALALLDMAMEGLGPAGVVARERALEVATWKSIAAHQPELPFEA